MTFFLKAYPRSICLTCAVFIACAFGYYLASDDAMPFGDGQHYATRAFALYGYLHTGQWSKFGDLLTSPKQGIAPLHYWLFFLLPKAWAGVATYVTIQLLSTYILLGVAIWRLCCVLNRPAWAPAIFLMCAVQNFALDHAYAFFLDMPFTALGILALSWQIDAWRKQGLVPSVLSGMGLGLLFWVKPANALVFLGTFLIAEIIRFVVTLRIEKTEGQWKTRIISLIAHIKGILIGFIPIAFLAFCSGAGQAILLLIDNNEVSISPAKLECTGLLRLFYFPLCLAYYYHVLTLLIVFGATIGFLKLVRKTTNLVESERFLIWLFFPVLVSYVILGETFSFLMSIKTMRSLLLELPVIWLLAFWCFEKWKIRPGPLFVAALIYGLVAFSQLFFNTFGYYPSVVDEYQLKGNWLYNIPQTWGVDRMGTALNREICNSIQQSLPQGGKISVNTKKIYFSSKCIYWGVNHESLLRGEPELYQVTTLFNDEGQFYRAALINCNMLILISYSSFQTDQSTWEMSHALFTYSENQWRARDKSAKIAMMPMTPDQPLGFNIIFDQPLNEAQIEAAMKAISCSESKPENEGFGSDEVHGHHYSWTDAWRLLWEWKTRRLG